jgi:hypothetical protein
MTDTTQPLTIPVVCNAISDALASMAGTLPNPTAPDA